MLSSFLRVAPRAGLSPPFHDSDVGVGPVYSLGGPVMKEWGGQDLCLAINVQTDCDLGPVTVSCCGVVLRISTFPSQEWDVFIRSAFYFGVWRSGGIPTIIT